MTKFIEWLAQILGDLILIAGFLWTGVKVVEFIFRQLRVFWVLAEFIWHRKAFSKWLDDNCEQAKLERGKDTTNG